MEKVSGGLDSRWRRKPEVGIFRLWPSWWKLYRVTPRWIRAEEGFNMVKVSTWSDVPVRNGRWKTCKKLLDHNIWTWCFFIILQRKILLYYVYILPILLYYGADKWMMTTASSRRSLSTTSINSGSFALSYTGKSTDILYSVVRSSSLKRSGMDTQFLHCKHTIPAFTS